MNTETQQAMRRRRVIYVSEHYVVALLSRGLVHNQFIRVPEPLGLPDTARVVGVWSDWQRNAFGIVVEDPSFDEVSEAVMLPEMEVRWSYVEVAVKPPATGLEGGRCHNCAHWEKRPVLSSGTSMSAAWEVGYCPLFGKDTPAMHGFKCTAHEPSKLQLIDLRPDAVRRTKDQ